MIGSDDVMAGSSRSKGRRASDPLAALEELAAEWEREGQIMARRLIAAPELRAAIAKTREALGEVEVREEWGVRHCQGIAPARSKDDAVQQAAEMRKRGRRWADSHVVSRIVGSWTPVEEA